MSNRFTNFTAVILLLIMLLLAFTSALGDSATMDELAHIPAGYSYLSQKDFRINPEHPPLIKDLSAIPLLFLNLNFPRNHPSWQKEVNGQWWFGSQFLYHSGNNPDKIIFWARIPMLLLLIFLGWFLFFWTKQLAGNKTALLVLTLFCFSPTFLAHGRLVTTDVAAALGVVISSYFWLEFLKNPSRRNIIFAGIIFGISMLFKFSLALLIPFFAVITVAYAWLNPSFNKTKTELNSNKYKYRAKEILKYIGLALLIGIIGAMVVWLTYQFHILNYPAQRQLKDSQFILSSGGINTLEKICIWMADKPGLRPYAHYLLGLLMANQRTIGGNTAYFFGIINNTGWWYYFPIVYILKVPLAFHVLTLIALFWAVCLIKKPFWIKPIKRLKEWIKIYFVEFSMMVFLAIYWIVSITGNLNIGVRHILPTFPFLYILVSLAIVRWLKTIKKLGLKRIVASLIFLCLGWYIISSIASWPFYLSYFNEIAGGTQNGYKYVVDSNYDWGQDLKRLTKFVKENKIKKIHLDYFGGGNPEYYLKEKYIPLNPMNLKKEPKGWIAVSATLLQGGKGNAAPEFNQPSGYYRWLDKYKPVARAGTSIFIYKID